MLQNPIRSIDQIIKEGTYNGRKIRVTPDMQTAVLDWVQCLCEVNYRTAQTMLRRILKKDPLETQQHKFPGQGQRKTMVAAVDAIKKLTSHLSVRRSKAVREKFVSDRIAIRENGRREVGCSSGTCDVITCQDVIEVKYFRQWKQAIGQSLVYALDCKLQPRIHLYGWSNEAEIFHKKLKKIKRYAAKLGIKVSSSVESQ